MSDRDIIRKWLESMGWLAEIELPDKPDDLPSEDTLPIELPEGSPTWAELLDEDRGEY